MWHARPRAWNGGICTAEGGYATSQTFRHLHMESKMTPSFAKSKAAFKRAKEVLVGGVNSPVRAFSAVGGEPLFISRAKGSHIYDIDGNAYIDYVGSWGPAILGHAYAPVVEAIAKAAAGGASFGAPNERETLLAAAVVKAVPSAQKVRFVSSGTEAVMSAVRLARGATRRSKIIKCIGGYHGHSDSLLVSAGSGATTLGVPSSPGVPEGATRDTLLTPYNDLPAAKEIFRDHQGEVAAVLIEPVAGNMGVVTPRKGYLEGLRALCTQHGALLIFDEVMTGFRLSYGGAQRLFGVTPDLTTLGKIIGGGLPVGAIAGPAKIMDLLAPAGPIYQAGTLSGNPLAMAAGLASLKALDDEGLYRRLETTCATLEAGLRAAVAAAGLGEKVCINRAGSMMTIFFTPGPVYDYATATAANTRAFAAYFTAMLHRGIYLPPSQYEAFFVSVAHSDADVEKTVEAAGEALAAAAALM